MEYEIITVDLPRKYFFKRKKEEVGQVMGWETMDLKSKQFWQKGQASEPFLKGKAQYSLHPCTN